MDLNLIFYGNTLIPLGADCSGCHYFNYECGGSVYACDCPIGQVKDLKSSRVASDLLKKIDENHFILARVCGYDMTSKDMLDHINKLETKIKDSTNEGYIEALKKAIANYKIALNKTDAEIEELKCEFNTATVFYSDLEESKDTDELSSEPSSHVEITSESDGSIPF